MSKHTPGPWRIAQLSSVTITDSKGALLADLSPAWIQQEREANAKLIAAAPKMLDALKSVIEWTEHSRSMPDDMRGRLEFYARREILIRNAARAAIEGVES